MNRLEEMIVELCPDGVEYRKIGDIAFYEQPSKYLVSSTDYKEEYSTPVLTAGQTFILGYTDEMTGIYPASKEKPVIIFDDFTGAFKWVDFPFKAKSSAMKMITANASLTCLRYLFHMMGFLNYSSDDHRRLWIGTYSEIQVPVPPLSVQHEIVRILDNFIELTTELTVELSARKQQFDYYCELLLSFDNTVLEKPLEEVAKVYDSLHQTPEYSSIGYSMIRVQDVVSGVINTSSTLKVSEEDYKKFTAKYEPQENDIVVSRVGSFGRFAIVPNEKCCLGQNVSIIHPLINPKYLYYFINTRWIQNWIADRAKGAGHKSFSLADIKKIPIKVPNQETQDSIVRKLDAFESICAEKIGLPAEILAREKQYEYYRDKLLSFKELSF